MTNKVAATNRKVFRDFQILETYEAGLVLQGSEVKSIRESNANLQDSYCKVDKGELFAVNMFIGSYGKSSHYKPSERRQRKLLMHKSEIKRLFGKLTHGGLTIIPLEIYFNSKGKAKAKIGLAKKLKGPDKRELIKKREIEKEVRQTFGSRTLR